MSHRNTQATFISGTLTPLSFTNTAVFFPRKMIFWFLKTPYFGDAESPEVFMPIFILFSSQFIAVALTTQGSLKRDG